MAIDYQAAFNARCQEYMPKHGTWAWQKLKFAIKYLILDRIWWPHLWDVKVCYCHMCGSWTWCTNETPAYSAYSGAYLCTECRAINCVETDMAWEEYHSGVL